MLPATASRMTQAISPRLFSQIFSKAPASLKGIVRVSAARASGTPGLPAIPKVATPEPAFTSSESAWPW